MDESTKQAYMDKMSAKLKEWDGVVDVIKAKMEHASADARVHYHEKLHELGKSREEAMRKLEEIREAGADKWEELKIGAEGLWGRIKNAFDDDSKSGNPNQH